MEKENENLKKIKVYVSRRKNNETGEEFNVYKALTKQGKIDLKFRKEISVEQLPTHTCYILVDVNNLNVNQKFEYPVMWVSKIEAIEEIEFNQNVSDYID